MEKPTDRELLDRIGRDDQEALEQLFQKYYMQLCDFAFRFVRSFDLSEEVVSDVFFAIWKNRHKLTIRGNIRSYIYSSVRNLSLNYVNREIHKHHLSLDELIHSASGSATDESLLYRELEHRVEKMLAELPPRRQLIFKMSRIEGFSHKEIADILSISVYTVQNQIVMAIRQLASLSEHLKSGR